MKPNLNTVFILFTAAMVSKETMAVSGAMFILALVVFVGLVIVEFTKPEPIKPDWSVVIKGGPLDGEHGSIPYDTKHGDIIEYKGEKYLVCAPGTIEFGATSLSFHRTMYHIATPFVQEQNHSKTDTDP